MSLDYEKQKVLCDDVKLVKILGKINMLYPEEGIMTHYVTDKETFKNFIPVFEMGGDVLYKKISI